MTVAIAASHELRCHRCTRWLGESVQPLEFVGIFKEPKDRRRLPDPRDSRQCKGCGWVNVFRPSIAGTDR